MVPIAHSQSYLTRVVGFEWCMRSVRSRVSALVLLSWFVGPGTASVAQGNDLSAQEHVRRANQFLTAQRADKAIPEFAAALAADPTNLDVKGNLGVLLYFQGELAKAEPYLREVVQQQQV